DPACHRTLGAVDLEQHSFANRRYQLAVFFHHEIGKRVEQSCGLSRSDPARDESTHYAGAAGHGCAYTLAFMEACEVVRGQVITPGRVAREQSRQLLLVDLAGCSR